MLNNQRVSNHSLLNPLHRFFVHPGQATGDLSRRPGATAQPFEAEFLRGWKDSQGRCPETLDFYGFLLISHFDGLWNMSKQ